MWKRVYFEGRCLRCGMRITVDCKHRGHTREGQWCGPIEIEHPFAVPDEPAGKGWMVPWSHERTPSKIRHPLPVPPPDGQGPATAVHPARVIPPRCRQPATDVGVPV